MRRDSSQKRDDRSAAGEASAALPPVSAFADLLGTRPVPRGVTVSDLAGLVIAFAVAAYIYRGTILAVYDAEALGLQFVAGLAFIWLGTVIAGPIVLAVRRVQHGRRLGLSLGEKIWGVLGLLWIFVGLARALRRLDPIAMTNVSSYAAAVAAGLAPILLLAAWYLERGRARPAVASSWCHHVGILCGAAWPAGWMLAAFLLGV